MDLDSENYQHNKHFLAMNTANAVKLGQMKHGDYLSIGIGKVVCETRCYHSDSVNGIVYSVEFTQYGNIVVRSIDHISLWHLLSLFCEYSMCDYRWKD